MKQREIKTDSKNLKSGFFKKDELELYEIPKKDIEIILKYQQELPILQEDNSNWINARDLHTQLGVRKDFTSWIKDRIEKYAFIENEDYTLTFTKIGERKNVIEHQYNLTVDIAKQLAMVQNNEKGQLARKYFIVIESAFKIRLEWNFDRDDTIDMFKGLKHALIKFQKQLRSTLPEWSRNNTYIAESCMLNNVLLGMSSSEYKKTFGLGKKDSIRNTFTEEQLEDLTELEKYDADLIIVQNIFDYSKRQEILEKKFLTMIR